MNPYKDIEDNSFTYSPHLTYEDIATKLLKDHYFLTALELHTELVESGKELPQLREFFSNPGNFEQHVSRASDFTSMHRSPSQATLDSLDTARYSEDGGGDRGGSGGDVAVLEFELRKARETINALRANLTQFADGESALDKSTKTLTNEQSLKPHEKRALNFLINEYLLIQDYKLTSITFSDENPDQEFEDWDDVGLNMPRPAGLVSLFRGKGGSMDVPKTDASTDTNLLYVNSDCQTEYEDNVCVSCQTNIDADTDWSHELLVQGEEIALLKQKVIGLETEKLNFQKLYDAAIVSLNSLTSPTSESRDLDLHLPHERLLSTETIVENPLGGKPITCMASENHYGSGNSESVTPEQFEMIDSEKNSAITQKESSTMSSFERSADVSPQYRGSATTLDETLSINDGGDWTRVHPEHYSYENKEMWIESELPSSLKASLVSWCCEMFNVNEPLCNDLLAELVANDETITMKVLINLVAVTLPRILPHTLVGRRVEGAAALAAGAALVPPGDARRHAAVHTLLTLLKRPDPSEARIICEATCLLVKWGAGDEILSSVAELLASRSTERRILASQICVAIAPYLPIELSTSLLLSLVTMMCESNEAEIRHLGLKAACVICPVAEHKYVQLENLIFQFLKDPAEKCVRDAVCIFAPVLARSALLAGKFTTDLFKRILNNIHKASVESEWKNVVLHLDLLKSLVLAQLAYVINVQIVKEVTMNDCDIEMDIQDVLLSEQDSFIDLQCYVSKNCRVVHDSKMMFVAMNSLVKGKPDVRWAELTWFIDVIKQLLEIATLSKALNHTAVYEHLISLFTSYVNNFSVNFTLYVLKPVFLEIITELEQKMEKLHSVNVDSTAVVGIYLVTVLPVLEDSTQHGEFLQKWVLYSSIRGLPVKIFSVPLKWISENRPDSLHFYLQHLREFAASSCESSSGSSVRVYIANLITELLNVTEIPEMCIERQLIPAAMALLHDEHVTVREVAITTWGTVTRSCLIRSLPCEEQCWPPLEDLVTGPRTLSGKEGARVAEALALLVLPTADNHAVSEKAVTLLCALCHRGAGASGAGAGGAGASGAGASGAGATEWVAGVTPGLQLAAHHATHHPDLLPALRKVEETIQASQLTQYKPAVDTMLHNLAGAAPPPEAAPKPTNLQTAQEVGRRVTQIFNQSKTNMHLQNIFKKKT